jgi:hypothetical protein
MALNTTNVVVALGQEYWLYLVLEEFEVWLNCRLLREQTWPQQRQKTQ